eukprot:scpid2278/ scgid23781/ UPF0544 protein C5orf45 homolog
MQSFIVVRCYSCCVFQVQQAKKVNKFACKMCNEKQSVKKVLLRGSGAECRRCVQQLNMKSAGSSDIARHSMISAETADASLDYEHCGATDEYGYSDITTFHNDVPDEMPIQRPRQAAQSSASTLLPRPATSKWQFYLDDGTEASDTASSSHSRADIPTSARSHTGPGVRDSAKRLDSLYAGIPGGMSSSRSSIAVGNTSTGELCLSQTGNPHLSNVEAATTAYSATSTSSTGHAGRSTVSTRHCVAASTVNPPSSRQSTSTVANHGKSDTRRQGEALPPRQTTAPSMHCGDVSNLAASCSPRRSWQDTPPAKRHCAASLSVRSGVRHSAHDSHQRTEIGQRDDTLSDVDVTQRTGGPANIDDTTRGANGDCRSDEHVLSMKTGLAAHRSTKPYRTLSSENLKGEHRLSSARFQSTGNASRYAALSPSSDVAGQCEAGEWRERSQDEFAELDTPQVCASRTTKSSTGNSMCSVDKGHDRRVGLTNVQTALHAARERHHQPHVTTSSLSPTTSSGARTVLTPVAVHVARETTAVSSSATPVDDVMAGSNVGKGTRQTSSLCPAGTHSTNVLLKSCISSPVFSNRATTTTSACTTKACSASGTSATDKGKSLFTVLADGEDDDWEL